jgi:hypothetical protein
METLFLAMTGHFRFIMMTLLKGIGVIIIAIVLFFIFLAWKVAQPLGRQTPKSIDSMAKNFLTGCAYRLRQRLLITSSNITCAKLISGEIDASRSDYFMSVINSEIFIINAPKRLFTVNVQSATKNWFTYNSWDKSFEPKLGRYVP